MKVAILGASGFAREARSTIDDLVRAGRDFTVIGFVDVNLPIGTDVAGLPVLGNEGWFSSPEARDVRAVIGIGDPAVRRRAVAGGRQERR